MDDAQLLAALLSAETKSELAFSVARFLVENDYAKADGSTPDEGAPKSWHPLSLTQKGKDALWRKDR